MEGSQNFDQIDEVSYFSLNDLKTLDRKLRILRDSAKAYFPLVGLGAVAGYAAKLSIYHIRIQLAVKVASVQSPHVGEASVRH